MKAKILIIDDGLDSWTLLSTILRQHDYVPIWAADGIQAMSLARSQEPALILLDLGLPGGDGLIVLERLKANRLVANIPVIVVTGRNPGEAEVLTKRLGAAAYLQKPVKAEELIALIKETLPKEQPVRLR